MSVLVSGSPSFITNEFNAKSVLRFSGAENLSVSDLLSMKGGDEAFTVFAVASTSQTTSSKTILGFGDNSSNPKESWRLVAGEDRYRSNFQGTTIRSNTESPSIISNVNKAALITMSYSGGGVNDVSNQLIYENGVLKTNTGSSGSYSGAALIADTPALNVGSGYGGVNSWEGDIAEVVIYNRLLSDHEREEVEAYLAQKWLDEPYKRSCQEIYEANNSAIDGEYTIDIDGYNGPMPPMTVSCEFIASGTGQGGWTLILNYLHQTGTTPDQEVRHYSLPTKGSDTLGTDESGTAHWGHASPGLLNSMDFSSMRWYCETSNHIRKMHFVSSDADMIDYARTGQGTDKMSAVEGGAITFADHTATWDDDSWLDNQGNYALTAAPFYTSGSRHWVIDFNSPATLNRWECDDHDSVGGGSFDTIHRIWVQ